MVDVGAGTLKLLLELALAILHAVVVAFPQIELPLDVFFLRQASVTLEHLALKADGQCLILVQRDLKLVDLILVGFALLLKLYGEALDLLIFGQAELLHFPRQLIKVRLVLQVQSANLSLPLGILLIV